MRRWAAVLLVAAAACGGGDGSRIVVAAGSTLVDSGIIDDLVAEYEAANPRTDVSVVGESTANVLELGRQGAADLLLTHAPALEEAFIADGLAARHALALRSTFVLVGPPGDARSLGGRSLEQSVAEIAARGLEFVSRADGSGTYAKELEAWAAAGVDPTDAPWYVETGQGMGLTLQVADQRGAFTISEAGAFLAASPSLSLLAVSLAPGDVTLDNPYRAIVVAGGEEAAAEAFLDWLLSDAGVEELGAANLRRFGRTVYAPAGSGPGAE